MPMLRSRGEDHKLLLCLLLSVVAALAMPAAAGAATTFTVNDNASGVGPPGATCATPTQSTIGAAVAASAAGDTILVCAGSYPETVSVPHRLTIRGAQSGVDARTRSVPVSQESVVGAAGGGIFVGSGVNDVTIDGFTVKDATANPGLYTPSDGRDQEIVNNIVTGNVFGLYLNNEAGGQTVIRHNLFFNNNQPGAAEGNGIYGDQGTDDVLIDANRFFDHDNTGILLTAVSPTTNDGVQITNNQLQNIDPTLALNLNRILLIFTRNATVSGNTITNPDATGIQLLGEDALVSIVGNTVVGDGSFPGIRIRDCKAVDCGVDIGNNGLVNILGNSLTLNSTGISVADDGYAGNLEVHFNRIAANSEGLRLDDTGESVDARNNWWGCNAGPPAAGCNSIIQADPGDVTFNPWLVLGISASPTTVPIGGSSTVTASLAQNSAGATPGPNNFPAGVPIAFSATFGSVSSPVATASPNAATTFHAGSVAGTGSANAQLDNQSVSTPVTVTSSALAERPPGRCQNKKTGTSAHDFLSGTAEGDRLKGKGGNDTLRGKAGDDCLSGGTENDRLNGGSGEDLLKGGAGDDVINAKDGEPDKVRCGFGDDRATVDAVDSVHDCETVG